MRKVCAYITFILLYVSQRTTVLFSKVIDDLEKGNGMFLDGILGSQPYELQENLIDIGYTTEAEHLYFKQK